MRSRESGYKILYGTVLSFLRKQESRETEAKSGFPLIAPGDSPRRKNYGNDRNRRNAFLFIIFFLMLFVAQRAHAVEYGLETFTELR